jgi:hypothetical protein
LSKEDKNIDNFFKEKLEGRSFDGPPADFLEDLNQRLDKKSRGAKKWIWLLSLILVVVGLFVTYITINSSDVSTTELEIQPDNEEQNITNEASFEHKSEQTLQSDKSTDSLIKRRLNYADRLRDSLTGSHDEKGFTSKLNNELTQENKNYGKAEVSQKENDAKQTSDFSTARKDEKKKDITNLNSSGIESSYNKFLNDNSKKESQTAMTDNNDKSSQQNKTLANLSNKGDHLSKTSKVSGNELDKLDIRTVSNENNEIIPFVASDSVVFTPKFNEIKRKTKTKYVPEFTNKWNEIIDDYSSRSSMKTTPQTANNKGVFELQVHGGIARWNYNTLGLNDNYINQIDLSGTPKWTTNFGLGLNANFNNISIGTGINYAKLKTDNLFELSEVNVYDSTFVAGFDEVITFDSINNSFDTTFVPYYDSITVSDTSFNAAFTSNEYEWIQIPLHIGYRFSYNKWAIIPRIGMNIGLGIRQTSGQYPDEVFEELQSFAPAKWNLNLQTSLEVRRNFGKLHAFGKLNYQRNLTNTIESDLFERRFNAIGFTAGVGYSF